MRDDQNIRLAFDRLDIDDTGRITLDNLLEFIGANSDELTIGEEITDRTLHEALIGKGGDGLSYEMVKIIRGSLNCAVEVLVGSEIWQMQTSFSGGGSALHIYIFLSIVSIFVVVAVVC